MLGRLAYTRLMPGIPEKEARPLGSHSSDADGACMLTTELTRLLASGFGKQNLGSKV